MYIAKHFLNEKSILYFYFGERIARVMASKQPYSFSFVKILKISSPCFWWFFPPTWFLSPRFKNGLEKTCSRVQGPARCTAVPSSIPTLRVLPVYLYIRKRIQRFLSKTNQCCIPLNLSSTIMLSLSRSLKVELSSGKNTQTKVTTNRVSIQFRQKK